MSAGIDYHRNHIGWEPPTQHAPRRRKRPDLCADYDHPGVTYNPWVDKTWCLCGEVIRDGDAITRGDWPHKADCCGGPLEEVLDD